MTERRSAILDVGHRPEWAFDSIADEPGVAFLESSQADPDAFSILTAWPVESCVDQLPPQADARSRTWREEPPNSEGGDPRLPPFQTGWIGYASYEAGRLWNRDASTRTPDPNHPLCWWGRYEASLAFRHRDQRWFVSWSETPAGFAGRDRLLRTLGEHRSQGPDLEANGFHAGPAHPEIDLETYRKRLGSVLELIARGDIYQANLTYRMTADFEGRSASLFHALRESNAAPFGAYLSPTTGPAILSSSPEQFLRIRGRQIRTRPIKGTRPRDLERPARDLDLARELLRSEKDRAELTMIVDLERNDLGRICEVGSVRTEPFPELESYRRVHHLVATVEGKLRPEVGLEEIFGATFPGGSITGAPKIRAMEILRDLESSPRFIYTGALGYLDDESGADLALTIRTMWIDGNSVHLGVGGGIVADSTWESEWEETRHKASALLSALDSGRDQDASTLRTSTR